MTQDELKQAVAREAIKYVVDDAWIGVGSGTTANFFIDELGKIQQPHQGRGIELGQVDRTPQVLRHRRRGAQQRRQRARLHRRRRRSDEVGLDDQGRRRRAHPREDRRGGRAQIRVHRRPVEAGAGAGCVSPAGRGDPDGAQLRRARARAPGRPAGVAHGLHHGQRQRHPRRVRADHRRSAGARDHDQRHRGRGHRRPVRPSRRRRYRWSAPTPACRRSRRRARMRG